MTERAVAEPKRLTTWRRVDDGMVGRTWHPCIVVIFIIFVKKILSNESFYQCLMKNTQTKSFLWHVICRKLFIECSTHKAFA